MDQLEPDSPVYNIPAAVRLEGQLQLPALQQAVQAIVNRHESLRTRFVTSDGQPQQCIEPQLQFLLPLVDLSALPEPLRHHAADQLAHSQARRPFQLSSLPLLRLILLRLTPQSHLALLNMHHIISDAWSLGIFINELAALYQAALHGQPDPLPPLALQYADFAAWQRSWLQGERLHSELQFWRTQLAEAPRLELPTDRRRPQRPSRRGASLAFSLPADLSTRLQQFSREQNVTLFMTLLAAFACVLSRYTGQLDLLIGAPIAGRNHAEIEPLIGFFVNNLVLRLRLEGNPSFRQLLARVRETTLQAYAHQDLPFDLLVEHLHPPRSPGRNPFFDVLVAFQNSGNRPPNLANLNLIVEKQGSGSFPFDLQLTVHERGDSLDTAFVYNSDLFRARTIRRFSTAFCVAATSMLEMPDAPIWQVRTRLDFSAVSDDLEDSDHDTNTMFATKRKRVEAVAEQATPQPRRSDP
jgi:non-ribosomal peptide synthetase component F